MAKKKRLGRGLDALIPDLDETVAAVQEENDQEPEGAAVEEAEQNQAQGVAEVPLKAIELNPKQPRIRMDPDELESLAASIRNAGVIQPVLVRPKGERFELVAGERRVRAAKLAGMDAVPAVVRDVPDERLLEIALIENIQRADLNPIERSAAVRQLMRELDLTQAQIGDRLGYGRSSIANMLRLLELPGDVQELVSDGELSEGHARALLAVPSDAAKTRLARRIIKEGLSVRAAEKLAKKEAEDPHVKRVREPAPHIVEFEENLSMSLGTKVRIQPKKKGGRMVIHFRNNNDFERIYERITGATTVDEDV
jgi:ParB family chromosome partitioning protein